MVYKGTWRKYTVAIKTMKEGCMDEDDFFDEAKIMMRFNHPNLIRWQFFSGLIFYLTPYSTGVKQIKVSV